LENESWIEESTGSCFDVTVGGCGGAEICELVGLYILNELKDEIEKEDMGLCRGDGLMVVKNKGGYQSDKIRKNIIQFHFRKCWI